MKRILVAVACLLPFGLAAEAGINRHSPEAAVNAVYVADEVALQGRGAGVMGDNTLRARFFSRSLLRSIAAGEIIASGGNVCRRLSAIRSPTRRLTLSPSAWRRFRKPTTPPRCCAEFARGDGAREQLTYAMLFERGEWRIDDIKYATLDGESHTLRGMLAAN